MRLSLGEGVSGEDLPFRSLREVHGAGPDSRFRCPLCQTVSLLSVEELGNHGKIKGETKGEPNQAGIPVPGGRAQVLWGRPLCCGETLIELSLPPSPPSSLPTSRLVFPRDGETAPPLLNGSAPGRPGGELSPVVERCYRLASRSLRELDTPDGCLMFLRRVLEGIVYHFVPEEEEPPGAEGGVRKRIPLARAIERLSREKRIPSDIKKMMHLIRELGNQGSHGEGGSEMDPRLAEDALLSIRELAHWLWVERERREARNLRLETGLRAARRPGPRREGRGQERPRDASSPGSPNQPGEPQRSPRRGKGGRSRPRPPGRKPKQEQTP